MNVDITSSLTSLLGTKANSNGNTYTGTHDFTGATVSGVSTTIADGSLTIAKTSGLQSALNTKLNRYVFNNIGTVTSNVTLNSSDVNKIHTIASSASRTVSLPANNTVSDGDWIYLNWMASGGTILMSVHENPALSLPVVTAGGGSTALTGGSSRTVVYSSTANKWFILQ
jgi:hypothetical protein